MDVLGAIVVDTQGAYIPPRRVRIREFVRYEKRKNIAYISCLAVAPAARRQGVATKLIHQAEQVCLLLQSSTDGIGLTSCLARRVSLPKIVSTP